MRLTSRLPVTSAAAAPGLSPGRPGFGAGIVLAAAVAAVTVLVALVALHLHR